MALLEQWRRTYPVTTDIFTAILGGTLGIGSILPILAPPMMQGTIIAPR